MNTPSVDEHEFIQGLDLDSDEREIKNGKSRFVQNGRSGTSDTNRVGVIESLRGNTSFGSIITGETVIGSCPDIRNNAVIQFVQNNTERNVSYVSASIVTIGFNTYLSIDTPSEPLPIGARVRITQGLNIFVGRVFSTFATLYLFTPISGSLIVGSAVTSVKIFGENLIRRWSLETGLFEKLTNPGLMGAVLSFQLNKKIINPRVIESSFGQFLTWTDGNVSPRLMNIDKMKEGGEYYSIANDVQFINLAKQPPGLPLKCEFDSDSVKNVNLLSSRFFQFRYRYVYSDGQISSLSPISDLTIPSDVNALNNVIKISFDTAVHQTVSFIEFIVREGSGVSKDGTVNTGWYSFLKIPTPVTSPVSFYGDENKVSVDSFQGNKLFESVPLLAGHIEVVNNSQILLGNITEGYDSYDGGHTVSVSYDNKRGFIIFYDGSYTSSSTTALNISNNVLPEVGDFMRIKGAGENIEITLTAADVVSNVTLANRISSEMNAAGTATSVSISGGIATVTITGGTPPFNTWSEVHSYPYKKVLPCIKANSFYDIGIVYYDECLRQSAVNIISRSVQVKGPWFKNAGIDIQWWGSGLSTNMPGFTAGVPIPDNFIGDKPSFNLTLGTFPAWARYFSIVITESYDDFNYLNFEIDPSRANGYLFKKLSGDYTIEKNDFIRFPLNGDLSTFGEGKSYKISDVSSDGIYFNIIKGDETITLQTRTCEVYKQRDKTNIYHEVYFDKVTTATTSFRIHKYNAFYVYNDKFLDNTDLKKYIETPSATNTNENWYWPIKGRVQVELPNSSKQQRIPTMFRWGGPLVNNTQVNDLCVWDEGNYNNELNSRFGDITGLRQRGYTLSILQWSNINKAFIARKELQNTDGNTQLVVTDGLIGSINPSEQEYGTKYPESVVVANNNLFFFDAIKGVYCMDAGNGVIPISDAGASRFWWNTSELVKSDSRYEVISGYDYTYDDLYVTVKLTEDNSSITIYFNVNDKQWKSFVEMFGSDETPIDWYGYIGQTFVTFLKGQLWKQNSLTEAGVPVYCKLFGVQRKFINEFVTNVDKSKVKVYLTHDMHVNTLPEITRFRTQANDMYPNGMYSELVLANYKYKEGVFYADIKNDAYTKGLPPNDTQKRLQIATGRPVRGHCLSVRMEFYTPKYVVLMSSGVGQIISDKS